VEESVQVARSSYMILNKKLKVFVNSESHWDTPLFHNAPCYIALWLVKCVRSMIELDLLSLPLLAISTVYWSGNQ